MFAIADLHLPTEYTSRHFHIPQDYWLRVQKDITRVRPNVLLIAGDLCWGNSIKAVSSYIEQIRDLPVKYKFFVEGNHDPWFETLGRTYEEAQEEAYKMFSDPSFYYIGGRATVLELENGIRLGICGAAGFDENIQRAMTEDEQIRRMYQLASLNRALTELEQLIVKGEEDGQPITTTICLLHHPPSPIVFSDRRVMGDNIFREIAARKIVKTIVYGHVHIDPALRIYVEHRKIQMYCAAVDRIGFRAMRILIP